MFSREAVIYVVDDDASVRKATCRIFRTAGFKVIQFDSADEFLNYPISTQPACVILDYRMPGRNGIEVQNELSQRGLEIPIVFITGHGDIPTSVTAIKQGAVDFLTKPVDDQRLIDTVETAIEEFVAQLDQDKQVADFKENLSTLTKRENDVLSLVVEGLLNKQIAVRLGVTEATVKVHRGRMMEKTGVDSLAELVRLCERSEIGR